MDSLTLSDKNEDPEEKGAPKPFSLFTVTALCVLAGDSGHDVVKTDLGRAVHQYLKGFEWTLEVQLCVRFGRLAQYACAGCSAWSWCSRPL